MDSTSDNEEMNCKMELGEPVVENKPPVSVNTGASSVESMEPSLLYLNSFRP